MTEEEERQKIIDTAMGYLGTPYHPSGRVKGVGVDCLTLLSCVWEDAGLLDRIPLPNYSPQFMHNRSDELYMTGLLEYTREVTTPQKGDIALWKFGRCFSHAAIVTEWPMIIHAYVGRTVQTEDVSHADWLLRMNDGKPRPLKFFSFWGR
jgi:cell wall-associated NlpC family hydrolase